MKPSRFVTGAVATTALALLAAATPSFAASNIDQNFALDGATTYCQGIKDGPVGVVPGLSELPADSAGKCPIGLTITAAGGDGAAKKGEKLTINWKAKANANVGVANNKFPNSVDVTSKVPKPVTASWLKACKAGTNCATVIDSTATGPANQEFGAFDATGSKDMRASEFTFPDAGDYIVIAKLMLPGDESLNAKSIEYVAMLKLRVAESSAPTPTPSAATPVPSATPTVAPTPTTTIGAATTNTTSGSTATNEAAVMKPIDSAGASASVGSVTSPSASASTNDVPSESTSESKSLDANTSSDSNGIFGSNSMLLGCVFAGCFVACVMGFAFVMRRRTESKMAVAKHGNHHLGASSGGPPDTGSVGMLDSGEYDSAKYVATTTARNKATAAAPAMVPATMSVSPPPVVFDASVRGSELLSPHSADEFQMRDVSEVSSLASEAYSDTMSNFDDASRETTDVGDQGTQSDYLGSFDWKESEDSRQSNFSIASKARGFSTASGLSDLSEGDISPRASRIASEASVDSYAFAPSPRSSTADSYMGGYSESSRMSGMSMYSDVSSAYGKPSDV